MEEELTSQNTKMDDNKGVAMFPAGLTMCFIGYFIFFQVLWFWIIQATFISFLWYLYILEDRKEKTKE